MKIISVNAGSSSLKFCLFDMDNESVIVKGAFERIGINDSFYTIKFNGEAIKQEILLESHEDAVNVLIEKLISLDVIDSLEEVGGVGHRVLHGGEYFKNSVIIDDEVINKIDELTKFGPLHHPGELSGIRAMMKYIPDAIHVAVFDTSFHQTIGKENFLFSVPYKWYEEYGIRKYGFHGTSHKYIAEQITDVLGTDKYKAISCHIGNGASICAIKDGKSIDTSMGFTPLGGVMMGTRSGDIDPSIIPYIMECEDKDINEIVSDLNRVSGILGLSEYSNDMRDIADACKEGNEKVIIAKDKYVRRIVDYIAQYYVLLNGIDIIVFTAGVGENNFYIRNEILSKLGCLGIKYDSDLSVKISESSKISTPDSDVLVYVIPTDEELMIARDTYSFMDGQE